MREAFSRTPVGARFYHGSRRAGGGNLMFLFGDADPPMLMKVYRPRGSRTFEALSGAIDAMLTGRSGVTAASRCRIERRNLELWNRHGLRVPRLFDRPVPAELVGFVNWIEYCPGRNLALLLDDDLSEPEVRLDLIRRVAVGLGHRNRVAEETGERGLVQECATVEHVLVQGDELVTIDHETMFRSRISLLEAMAREIGGVLRSIARAVPGPLDEALAAFVSAYPDPVRLRRVAEWGVAARGPRRRLERLRTGRSGSSWRGDGIYYALLDQLAVGAGRA